MRRLRIAVILPLLVMACGGTAGKATPLATPGDTASTTTPGVSAAPAKTKAPAPTRDPAIVAMIETALGPIGLAATEDAVWVENHRARYVSRIDPIQNLQVEKLGEANIHCDIAAGGGFVWATEAAANSVRKIDAATNDVLDSISLTDACGVAADADEVWISSPGQGTLVRYDAKTAKVIASIDLAPMVFFVAIGPEAVWVVGEAGGGTVYRINPATNKVVATIHTPNQFATDIAAGHGAVWVPARDNKVVYRIDPATNAVTATIKMPSPIGGLGVGPDAIWTSGFGDGKVYRIDPATNQITASVSTGQGNLGPPLVAFGSVWVAALDRNLVVRIDPAAIH